MSKQIINILMSIYNEPISFVTKSIQSILNQTYPFIRLIIILDDPTNTSAINYVKEKARLDERIEYHVNEKNMGLVYSLNRALSYAKGEYIARMDADDIAYPNRLEMQYEYLIKNKLDLVGGLVVDIDENGKVLHGVTSAPESHAAVSKYLRYGSPLAHPTWFGKRSVFDGLNGYQSIDACEDYDFLCRAVLCNYKLGVVQKPLLKYRINSAGISSTKRSIQKTALYYIRQRFRKGKSITALEMEAFTKSSEGKKKKAALDQYFSMSAELKKKNGLSYFLYGAYMFAKSSEARGIISTIMAGKKIISKEKKKNG